MASATDVNDIEDITSKDKLETHPIIIPNAYEFQNRESIVKRKNTARSIVENISDIPIPPQITDINGVTLSNVPGIGTVYMKTWGCSHNHSDGEYMAGQLANYGYQITNDKEKADVWVLNSCTVKTPSEDGFKNFIKEAKSHDKYVVLAGCVPQADKYNKEFEGVSSIGVQQIDRVVEVVEETLKGNKVRLFQTKKLDGKKIGGARLDLPKIRKNPLIEIIAINTGCLNNCTYCKTKHARGDLGSYQIDEIVSRAKQSFKEGVVELWLTSEDLGAYGRDIGVTLPDLLWELVEVIPDGCMMRLGMTNPPYILEHIEEMVKILSHPRVYSFLHIPVQSGSDKVLEIMKREYTIADFKEIVYFLKQKIPRLTIATDIICGFPTETIEDFEETLKICREFLFPSLFINQFYPRPNTPAAKMKRIPTHEVKRRSKQLTDLFQSYKPYEHKIGEIQEVLVTEIAHDKKHFVAHNKFYEQVLVSMRESTMGKKIRVRITDTGKHHMEGQLIEESITNAPKRPPTISHKSNEKSPMKFKFENQEKNSSILYYVIVFVLIIVLLIIQFDLAN